MRTIFRLIGFLKPYWGEVLLSIFLGVATIGAGIGLLGTSAYLIATAALHPSIAELQVAIVGVRFFGISRAAFRYGERLVSHSVNLRLLSSLRIWYYRQVEQADQRSLSVFRTGDLLDRTLRELETLENFYVRVFSPLIVFLIVTTGVSFFVGRFQPALGWILATGLFVSGIVLPVVSIIVSKGPSRKMAIQNSNLSAQVIETLDGLEELQAFGTSHVLLDRIRDVNKNLAFTHLRTSALGGMNNGLIVLISSLTILLLIWVSITDVQVGLLTGIILTVVVQLALASFEASGNLPTAAQKLTESISAAKKIFEIADLHAEEPKKNNLQEAEIGAWLTFDKVCFTNEEDAGFSLADLSFDVEIGKKIAVVGPSGAGKSSLIDLILKFTILTSGKILFNGRDIAGLTNESIRANFSVMAQDGYLFNCSLKENLLLAKPGASDGEITGVLAKVGLAEWLLQLPRGLDTWLGDRATAVSGGEFQRIMLARMMFQDRPFLILDEPMTNLDSVIKRDLLNVILSNPTEKGLIWISHDYSFMEEMDEILYLEDGQIIERGTHTILLALNGKYAQNFRSQHSRSDEDRLPD